MPEQSLLECTEVATGLDVPGTAVELAAREGSQPARKNWPALLAKFTSIQVVVQILGITAGILIVRQLPKREYAFYTIGNTMLSTILLLADSGISSGLSAIGGRVWQDRCQLGSLLNTALELRRQLALVTVVAVVPVLVWLLRQNGAHAGETAILVAAVLAGAGFELVTRIYAVALRLKSAIRQIQTQALVAALAKLAVVGVAVFLYINAFVAILSVVAGYALQYWMLRAWAEKNIETSAASESTTRLEIASIIRNQAPHTVYYCLQGQIAVWLISVFGNADRVAEVGALGRLAMIFAVLSSVTGDVVLPAFARLQSPRQIRRRYCQIVAAYFVISFLMVSAVAIFPRQILFVLGSQYSGLLAEGILMAASAVVGALAALLWAVNTARAWIVPPQLLIPCTIVLQAVLAAILQLSTVRGVLLFSMFTWLPSILLSVWYAFRKMGQLEARPV